MKWEQSTKTGASTWWPEVPIQLPLLVFINKLLLECSHTHHLNIGSVCFGGIMAELCSYGRNHMVQKAKNSYYVTLFRKHLPAPKLEGNQWDPEICVLVEDLEPERPASFSLGPVVSPPPYCLDCGVGICSSTYSESITLLLEITSYFGEPLALIG